MFNLLLIIYLVSAVINFTYAYEEMREITPISNWITNEDVIIAVFIPIINSVVAGFIIVDLIKNSENKY
jgi:hypothetical protein